MVVELEALVALGLELQVLLILEAVEVAEVEVVPQHLALVEAV